MKVSLDIIHKIATVLFMEVQKQRCQSVVLSQLIELQNVLKHEMLIRLFSTGRFPVRYKLLLLTILKKIISNKLLYQFLYLLIIKKRLGFLVPQVIDHYFLIADQDKYKNRQNINIKFAGNLLAIDKTKIKQQLGMEDDEKFNVLFERDDRLLYGIQIFSKDYVLDLSARKILMAIQLVE